MLELEILQYNKKKKTKTQNDVNKIVEKNSVRTHMLACASTRVRVRTQSGRIDTQSFAYAWVRKHTHNMRRSHTPHSVRA